MAQIKAEKMHTCVHTYGRLSSLKAALQLVAAALQHQLHLVAVLAQTS